jgi:hypothetical protein
MEHKPRDVIQPVSDGALLDGVIEADLWSGATESPSGI